MAALPHRAARPQGVDDWLDRYRRFWDESFDRLDDYLRELQTKENKKRRRKRKAPPVRKGTPK